MMRRRILDVIPECYVDTNLTEWLLKAGVNHQHSCSKVVNLLKTTFSDGFAVGIIDKDKEEPGAGYMREFDEIGATRHLTLLKHKAKSHYLITVRPAMDCFILDCAREQGVNPEDFGLPGNLKAFIKVSKSVTSNTDKRFRALFDAIKDNAEIGHLGKTLAYLCESRYEVDADTLKMLLSL